MKTQIGLGALSIPSALDTLGLIPGLICMLAIAVITTWSDYMIGVFKLNHRQVHSIANAGGLMFGRFGRLFFGEWLTGCLPDWIFVAGSGMLGISIGLSAVSTHGACTAMFVAVAAVIGFVFGSIRTLGKLGFPAWLGHSCVLTAIFTVTIAVGIQDRSSEASHTPGPWASDYELVGKPSFTEAITAMRDPRYYTRSLMICQSGVTAIHITIGTVVYYYCGSYVASPALGSAGPTVKKVAYGFALPGLTATTMLVIHLPAKILSIRLLHSSRHLTSNTPTHWITWLSCTFGITIIAYIIASAIPVFNGLVSLVGALLGTLMSFQPMGCSDRRARWVLMVSWCVFDFVIGMFCMVSCTYGSVVGVVDSYRETGGIGGMELCG
ncbi:hypothetical protein BDW71DRAFT_194008 [Aspergillus fruticulosus]